MIDWAEKKLIILDRDGVINADSDEYVKSADEWQPLPGSIAAIAALKKAGFLVAVATNQSGIGRGLFGLDALKAMHEKLATLLSAQDVVLDALLYCPHGPTEGCACRKPAPGMIKDLLAQFSTPPEQAVVIGDSLRDLQAASAAGVAGLLVKTGKGEKTLATQKITYPVYADLAAIAAEACDE